MKYPVLGLLAFLLVFNSCTKDSEENSRDTTEIDNNEDRDNDGEGSENGDGDDEDDKIDDLADGDSDCFNLIYPVSYSFPDGSVVTGTEEEIDEAFKEYYENSDSAEEAELIYPVQIAFPDRDDIVTVTSSREMDRYLEDCESEESLGDELKSNDCYEIVYPVSYTVQDGTTFTGNREELEAQLEEWYTAHPDAEKNAELVFPIEIIWLESNETITIESFEDLAHLRERCRFHEDDESSEDRADCITYVFPLSMTLPDGSIISGNEEELDFLIDEWYKDNPTSDREPQLVFPIEIYLPSRDVPVTVNNLEELERYYELCDEEEEEEFDCPELRADIGDSCRKDDGTEGVLNSECLCE